MLSREFVYILSLLNLFIWVYRKNIEKLSERFSIREIAFDRWGAIQMVHCNNYGTG